jgi:hypothetical protein
MKSSSGGISESHQWHRRQWRQHRLASGISGMAAGRRQRNKRHHQQQHGISEKMAANLATWRGAWRNGVINE